MGLTTIPENNLYFFPKSPLIYKTARNEKLRSAFANECIFLVYKYVLQ